jgi:L-arabinokinase
MDDAEKLLSVLGRAAFRGSPLFDRALPLTIARAPGRLDVMGGFADYSGSLALEMPIAEAAFVAAQASAAPRVRLLSIAADGGPDRALELSLDELCTEGLTWAGARSLYARDATSAWAGYVGGALTALAEDYGARPSTGLDVLLWSRVPEGKGVSSSAAIEVAALYALASLFGVPLDPVGAALSCQRVENLVVGAPCGVMDQMTSSCGIAGQLLPLSCQPAKLEPCFSLPDGLALWGIDSGIRHQVSGADYRGVRAAAFMGYRIIAERLSMPIESVAAGRARIRDDRFAGYLANVPAELFRTELAAALPEQMTGREFLERHGGITDPLTEVRPGSTYRVRAATAHPVFEQQRASEFRERMCGGRGAAEAERLGALMSAAHESYTACGLASTGTDRLVQLVREEGSKAGLFGAKITGGGSGGTVAVLGLASAHATVQRVARRYAAETGHEPYLFVGSSSGAATFGTLEARFREQRWQAVPSARTQPVAAQ